jgi:hypothetical protein
MAPIDLSNHLISLLAQQPQQRPRCGLTFCLLLRLRGYRNAGVDCCQDPALGGAVQAVG